MLVFLHSLKSRLLFLIFIITLPGLIAIFYQADAERSRAITELQNRAIAVVKNITAEQVEIIEETESFLIRLSKSPMLSNLASSECSAFLAHIQNLTDNYVNLGAPSVDGKLLCNALPLDEPVNVADRPYIQHAIQNRGFSIGQFQFDRSAQTSSINFAYPIINPENNQVVGLTVAVISLNWWSKRLDHASLPEDSVSYITDAKDKIIAIYPENPPLLGTSIKTIQGVAQFVANKQTKIIKDANGLLRIFVSSDLITVNGHSSGSIVVGIPIDKELTLITSRFQQIITLFLLFVLLIVIFAIWSTEKSILAPLRALKTSTKQLESGVHIDENKLSGTAELVDLKNHFSIMAKTRLEAEQQLRNNQIVLQKNDEKLSRHIKNTPLGSIAWDINFICTDWNKAAEKIFGYSANEAIGSSIIELIVPPKLKSKFIRNYTAQLQDQERSHCENVLTTKSGKLITCNFYNTLMLEGEGLIGGVASLVQDITVDKRNQDILDRFFELPVNLHLIVDFDGRLLRVNEAWENTLGYRSAQLIGQSLINIVHPEDIEATNAEIKKVEQSKETYYFENRCRTNQNTFRLIAWSATASNHEETIYAVGRDITESRLAVDELKQAAVVFTHAKEAIIITDAMSNIINVNQSFVQLSGYSREEAIGQTPKLFKSNRQPAKFYRDMWQSINDKGHWSGEIWNRRKSGEIYPQLMTISSVFDEDKKVKNYIALFTDISALKAHQKQLEHITHYDPLTNLPNRILLADRLVQAMPQCIRQNQSLAVAFLDLDGFKEINDNHGRAIGDKLLVEVARRINNSLRDGDTLSRFGGDEFVAVLVNLENHQASEPILESLLTAISAPVMIGPIVLEVSASIGVTIYPHDGVNAEQLLRHADQAMYNAKQEGKNRYHLFDMAEDIAMKHQHESLLRIRTALQEDEFTLYYQPKVNMQTGELIGAEALIRWQHPERGLLSPIEFLPIIERHTLTIEVGEWVIDSALKQISTWQKLGLKLTVSVNINALQLQQNCFVKRLAALLAAHPDVDPSALELEVLETSKLSDISDVSKIMRACIELGVSFALDDFGTGYCSLTYLKQLPVSLIKIDQSFIRDMLDDPDDLAIVKGVIGLSRAFQRDVIAEGVETLAHGAALMQLGCYLAQGYGIAKPMPAEELPEWAKTWQPDQTWTQIKAV
ncbi:hypothetical protein GCM10007916_30870 [Psychromonas marina]|uniref:EAL domain-containing protein n=1 Tax=Psychromonas marina TaxID=88364 RepID=A0ABQ6E3J3_9GAMM|nr:EAL domain-containing protein [Psychromonas marina]GLS92017.1 hypothetical protein GCM10007916_30870 [Psychromonas marina]